MTMKNEKKTGYVYDEYYSWHDTHNWAGVLPPSEYLQPFSHTEHPETKRRIDNLLRVSGFVDELVQIKPRKATYDELLSFHTADYVEKIQKGSEGVGGDAGMITPFGRGSFEIARLALGGVLAAVDAIMTGQVDNAYALVRPPGHHAMPDHGIGFCIFANGVIGAKYAMEKYGLKRIAFVDWDVHHGNSAEYAFYDNPDVLTISVHQDNCFPPDSGHIDKRGEGEGYGYNINVPLMPGCGIGAYEALFERAIVPALEAFQPELIIVPSGLDSAAQDPLGRMMMYSEGFQQITSLIMDAADRVCDGKLLLCHEGGYWGSTTPFDALAIMETLSGKKSKVDNPFIPLFKHMGGQTLQPHQDDFIKTIEAMVDELKSLEDKR